MAILTNQKATIYRNLYENTDPVYWLYRIFLLIYHLDGPDAKLQKPRSKRMMFIVTIGAGGLLVLLTLCLLGWWYLGESKDTDDEVAEVKPGQHDEMCPRKPGLPAVILAGEITGITHGTEGFTCHNTGNGYAGKSRK